MLIICWFKINNSSNVLCILIYTVILILNSTHLLDSDSLESHISFTVELNSICSAPLLLQQFCSAAALALVHSDSAALGWGAEPHWQPGCPLCCVEHTYLVPLWIWFASSWRWLRMEDTALANAAFAARYSESPVWGHGPVRPVCRRVAVWVHHSLRHL